MTELKTREERIKLAVNLMKDLRSHHIPDTLPGVIAFKKILKEYSQPELKSGFSGKIKILEVSRIIDYDLPLRKLSEPMVRLRHVKQ